MTPYITFVYFSILLLYIVLPTVLLSPFKKFTRFWLVAATAIMLVIQYSDVRKLTESVQLVEVYLVVGFAVLEWAIAAGFLLLRKRGANRWIFYLALLLGLAPLLAGRIFSLSQPDFPLVFAGLSYVTFRSLDVTIGIHDGLIQTLPPLQYLAFLLFFPTISSGPIDRYQRFAEDWRRNRTRAEFLSDLDGAVHRVFTGFLYKFILAALIKQYWLDPTAPPDQPAASRTEPALLATAYFARSAELLATAAGVLGRVDVERRYSDLADRVRKAFNDHYVSPAGGLVSDSATAYSLALQFGLLPNPAQRRQAGQRLATMVRRSRYRISTGFLGTPLICDALCSVGEERLAFRLLLQRECPSWLYPVTMGATTMWERWDSMLPDGTVNPGEMTSFNHYAFGAIGDWLHRTVAGLSAAAPGYRKIEVKPLPGGGLTHAQARHRTPYGLAESGWRIDGDTIAVRVVVPPGTTASVLLPWAKGKPIEVGAGTHTWSGPYARISLPLPTMDSTVEDLVDHEVWAEIIKAVPSLASIELELQGWGGMTVREMLWFRRLYDTPAWTAVEQALASPAR